MRKQKIVSARTRTLMVVALLYPVATFAVAGQPSGSATPPPGTNSLGTANSSGVPSNATVGTNMEPKDSQRIDTEIKNENSRIDSKINGICRGC